MVYKCLFRFNNILKNVWEQFRVCEGYDSCIPPSQEVTSSYLRHVFVTAIHSDATVDRKTTVAKHMSHSLKTAETHYDASGGIETTSNTTGIFRQLMACKAFTTLPPADHQEYQNDQVYADDDDGLLYCSEEGDDVEPDSEPEAGKCTLNLHGCIGVVSLVRTVKLTSSASVFH